MSHMKIAACMIVKNEEEVIDRVLSQLTEGLEAGALDEVCIVDTGSTDATLEKLREVEKRWNKVHVHQIEWPESFADARNAATGFTDADLAYMLDADDVLRFDWQDWRKTLEKLYESGRRIFGYPYVLRFDEDMKPLMTLTRQFLFDPSRYKYVGHAHECPDGPFGQEYAYLPDMMVFHKPEKKDVNDHDKRTYYAKLLRRQVEETPDNPRWLFYLGRELSIIGEYAESIERLERYIETSNYPEERTDARVYRALSLMAVGRRAEAEGEFFRAWIEDPLNREPLFVFAERLYHEKAWRALVTVCEVLIDIPYNAITRYGQRRDTSTWRIYDYLCIGCYYAGDRQKALVYGRHALEYRPDDQRLQENVRLCEREIAGR